MGRAPRSMQDAKGDRTLGGRLRVPSPPAPLSELGGATVQNLERGGPHPAAPPPASSAAWQRVRCWRAAAGTPASIPGRHTAANTASDIYHSRVHKKIHVLTPCQRQRVSLQPEVQKRTAPRSMSFLEHTGPIIASALLNKEPRCLAGAHEVAQASLRSYEACIKA
jgi:hypothetical protein